MALIGCKECGNEVSDKAEACPECGHPISPKEARLARKPLGCGTLLGVLLLLYIVIAAINSNREQKERAEAAAQARAVAAAKEQALAVMTEEDKLAAIGVLEAELKTIPGAEYAQNIEKYKELVALDPDNPRYAEKVVYYEGRLAREKKIKAQFSSWSGAHRALEKYVKENLKDPDSYEHIESRWGDKGDYIDVVLKYRARNSFGGYVIEYARASCTIEGSCTVL